MISNKNRDVFYRLRIGYTRNLLRGRLAPKPAWGLPLYLACGFTAGLLDQAENSKKQSDFACFNGLRVLLWDRS